MNLLIIPCNLDLQEDVFLVISTPLPILLHSFFYKREWSYVGYITNYAVTTYLKAMNFVYVLDETNRTASLVDL